MAEEQVVVKSEAAPTASVANWPGAEGGGVKAPVTQAALLNAAARAAASNSRRDLVEYLRLRRKAG